MGWRPGPGRRRRRTGGRGRSDRPGGSFRISGSREYARVLALVVSYGCRPAKVRSRDSPEAAGPPAVFPRRGGLPMRTNAVKRHLKEGKPVVGTWLTLGSVPATRFLARTGFAYLTVDIEHNQMGMETAATMFGAIADAHCVALARVPSGRHDHIKRALDNGAHGIVVPMVNTRAESLEAVGACLYPPVGNRSVGGSLHALNFDTDAANYYAKANDEILIIL